jgi:hypothetical protein
LSVPRIRKRDEAAAWISKRTLLLYYKAKYRRFQDTLPLAQQLDHGRLLQHVETNRDTGFGRDHHFSRINSIEAFREQVPIAEYSDLKPYLDAVANGTPDALFSPREHIIAFACTSGSTGDPKILPVTRSWLKTYQYHWQIWGLKAVLDHQGVMTSKWLQISGPSEVGRTASGHQIGMASAITARHQNPLFQTFYAVPYQVGDIADGHARNYTILRLALPQRVGFLMTITAANLIRLAELGDEMKQTLVRDLFDGTLTGAGGSHALPEGWMRKAAGQRHPERARQLENVIKQTGTLYPKDYWPLQLLACWTGGTVGYQSRSLPKYFGDAPLRDLGYLSTEGRHTIPTSDYTASGVLVTNGAFYEFIEDGSNKALCAHELEAGQSYSVLMTNAQGLYRYRIGDIVRCNGYEAGSPILEFLRKTDQFSDMEGEKISGDQIASAVSACCERLSLPVEGFSAVPMRPKAGPPYYGILLEALDASSRSIEEQLVSMIDDELRAQNIMYRQKRADGSLAPMQLMILAPGSFTQIAMTQGAVRGTGDTQHKQPVILDADQLHTVTIERTVRQKTLAKIA